MHKIAIAITLLYSFHYSFQNICTTKTIQEIMVYSGLRAEHSYLNGEYLVGILTLPLSHVIKNKINHRLNNADDEGYKEDKLAFLNSSSYFPKSYASWIQEYGVKIIPLDINDSEENLSNLMDNLDGLLLTGGATPVYEPNTIIKIDNDVSHALHIKKPSVYAKVVAKLINKAKEINDKGRKFPVWGTCLGFESMLLADEHYNSAFFNVENENHESPLILSTKEKKSDLNLFNDFTITEIVENNNIFFFNHKRGFLADKFIQINNSLNHWQVLATSKTKNNHEIVAFVKSSKYPFFGVQYHPEKIKFEHNAKLNIDRSENAINLAEKMAIIFISSFDKKANKTNNRNNTIKEISKEKVICDIESVGVFDEIFLIK